MIVLSLREVISVRVRIFIRAWRSIIDGYYAIGFSNVGRSLTSCLARANPAQSLLIHSYRLVSPDSACRAQISVPPTSFVI